MLLSQESGVTTLPSSNSPSVPHGRKPAGSYGIDAPYVPVLFSLAGIASLVSAALGWLSWLTGIVLAVIFLVQAALYLRTTLYGKFSVWYRIFADMDLRNDERILDVGCGHAMALAQASRFTSSDELVGVDIWSNHDQSDNTIDNAVKNMAANGAEERCQFDTADMRQLPYPDDSFDLVVSNAAIHNIKAESGREQALAEIMRVTKPGGQLVLVDLAHTKAYANHLATLGAESVTVKSAGFDGMWGNPFYMSRIVTARKSEAS